MKVRNQRWRFYKKRGGPRGIGHRCKGEQYLGCIVCASYDYLDKHGKFPDFETAHAITMQTLKEEEERERGLQAMA